MWTAPLLGLQRAEMDSFQRRQEQPGEQGNESRENGKARENVILKTQRGLRGKEHTDRSLRREGGIYCSLRQNVACIWRDRGIRSFKVKIQIHPKRLR